MLKTRFFLFTFLVFSTFLYGENLRGELAGLVTVVSGDEINNSIELNIDELAAFAITTENPFLIGVELRMDIPRSLQEYRNSFGLYLYQDITPVPNLNTRDYRGQRTLMHILPSQNQLSIKIPLVENHSIVKDATSVVSSTLVPESFPLILTILPIMKGIPDSAYSYPLNVTAYPIYADKGGLSLQLEGEEEILKNSRVYVDSVEMDKSLDLLPLSTGMHTLVIVSPDSGSFEYNIPIEQGKIYALTHKLESLPCTIEIPENLPFPLKIDGQVQNSGVLELSPGEHFLEYILNENYILQESFQINPGENMLLDLELVLKLQKKS